MARVDFDFSGSLELARLLWQMADSMNPLERRRSDASELAAQDWEGPHGDEFRTRAGNEPDEFTATEERLRSAADSWAEAWARATDEQRRRDHQDKIEQERASRGSGEQFFDVFLGDDSADVVGPPPAPVTVPGGPTFTPTA